jgi:hypothetical protein
MAALPNIDQIVAMYWEADRSSVQSRLGVTRLPLPSNPLFFRYLRTFMIRTVALLSHTFFPRVNVAVFATPTVTMQFENVRFLTGFLQSRQENDFSYSHVKNLF